MATTLLPSTGESVSPLLPSLSVYLVLFHVSVARINLEVLHAMSLAEFITTVSSLLPVACTLILSSIINNLTIQGYTQLLIFVSVSYSLCGL